MSIFRRSISKVTYSPHYFQRVLPYSHTILRPLLEATRTYYPRAFFPGLILQGVIPLQETDRAAQSLYRDYCQAENSTIQKQLLTARPVRVATNLSSGEELIGAIQVAPLGQTTLYLMGIHSSGLTSSPNPTSYINKASVNNSEPATLSIKGERIPIRSYQSIWTPQPILTPQPVVRSHQNY